jgi:hypothetical protein
MAEGRLPKIALQWMPKQKREKKKTKKNWMEGQWEDRKQWSLGVGQSRKTF